jgi:hypothetical protein
MKVLPAASLPYPDFALACWTPGLVAYHDGYCLVDGSRLIAEKR